MPQPLIHRFRWVFLVLLALPPALHGWPAAPPPLSEAQRTLMKERSRLFDQASRHLRAGTPAEAVPLVQKALRIEQQVGGEPTAIGLKWLGWLGSEYRRQQRYAAAIKAFAGCLAVLKRRYGEEDWRTADTCYHLAETRRQAKRTPEQKRKLAEIDRLRTEVARLLRQGKASKALEPAQKALALCREVQGEKHLDYSRGLSLLAVLHQEMADFAQAVQFARQSRDVCKEVLGERHPAYATSLTLLGVCYQNAGEQRRTLALFRQASAIQKAALGEAHPEYASSLYNVAQLLKNLEEYDEALRLFLQVKAIRQRVLGERHPGYAQSLDSLAVLYHDLGDLTKALALHQQAVALRKAVLGEAHPDYAVSLSNLASVYQDLGDYRQALPLLRRALAINRSFFGPRDSAIANGLNDLAMLYSRMGDYRQALALCRQATALSREIHGEKHPNHAFSLNILALQHTRRGEHQQALLLLQQALAIIKAVQGEKHVFHAISLSNLAAVHQELGEHKQALPLIREARDLSKAILGDRHPLYATSLHSLATVYSDAGQYDRALPLLHQAMALRREWGIGHPEYIRCVSGLALLHQRKGEPFRALPLCGLAFALTRQHLRLCASVQSERQQLEAARAVRLPLDQLLTLTASFPELAGVGHEAVLSVKGAVFLQQQQRRLLLRPSTPAVRLLLRRLQQTNQELATLALRPPSLTHPPPAAQQSRVEELTRVKEDLETELSGKSEDFRRQHQRFRSADLQQVLPAGVALVDFYRYRHSERGALPGYRLAAFVLRRDAGVMRIDLGAADTIEQTVDTWRQTLGKPRDQAEAGLTLRRLVWQPLEKHLGGARVVLLSPDGALARLPFAALPGAKKDTFLIEEVALAVVPVPHLLPDLLERPPGNKMKPSLLLVGDVDFASASTPRLAAGLGQRSAPRGALKGWGALPGTAREVAAVKAVFNERFADGRVADLRQGKASKLAVRQALTEHAYAHLATHGFFAPAELMSALAGKDHPDTFALFGKEGLSGWHPLLLSGIVLAGANKEAKPGEEDGILTALEVADLDLRSCDLVTLSACETGLGEVAGGGEGVLGLQRAFQVAGARATVTSLWSVSDAATSVLMEQFYSRLWGEKKVAKLEALRQAQLFVLNNPAQVSQRAKQLRADLVKRGLDEQVLEARGLGRKSTTLPGGSAVKERSPAGWWAAFILTGDWR
jgi:CHAT domain-containing protein/tetratricopeptide (TPR) repeat protein